MWPKMKKYLRYEMGELEIEQEANSLAKSY